MLDKVIKIKWKPLPFHYILQKMLPSDQLIYFHTKSKMSFTKKYRKFNTEHSQFNTESKSYSIHEVFLALDPWALLACFQLWSVAWLRPSLSVGVAARMVKHICQVPKVYDCPRHRWVANEVSYHRREIYRIFMCISLHSSHLLVPSVRASVQTSVPSPKGSAPPHPSPSAPSRPQASGLRP